LVGPPAGLEGAGPVVVVGWEGDVGVAAGSEGGELVAAEPAAREAVGALAGARAPAAVTGRVAHAGAAASPAATTATLVPAASLRSMDSLLENRRRIACQRSKRPKEAGMTPFGAIYSFSSS